MAENLGILVSSDKHMDYVVKLTSAAHEKGKAVRIFFTGNGVLLTQSPEFKNLVGSLIFIHYRTEQILNA